MTCRQIYNPAALRVEEGRAGHRERADALFRHILKCCVDVALIVCTKYLDLYADRTRRVLCVANLPVRRRKVGIDENANCAGTRY